MKYYLEYRTGQGVIENGFLEICDEHSAKCWFMKNKPAGYKLRKLRLLGIDIQLKKYMKDLTTKFINEKISEESKKEA